MAWDSINRVIGSNGQITMTPGYLSESVAMKNNADVVTSHLPVPVKSDFTILLFISDGSGGADLAADTYLQVEHSVDGETYVQRGDIETELTTASPLVSDISKNMAKIGVIDIVSGASTAQAESDGMMFMYSVETHGMSPYTRFVLKANGQDERANTATFHIIPHY
mgnify:CR=1 FL=1|tara:strand:- start:3418 stop:3915 length:498 start_codon:yes stop_codon:yes gene_type:complete